MVRNSRSPESPSNVAIGYVRVSTEEQATEDVSLEAQRAKVVAYCALHGVGLPQTYADEGLSGKRADNGPGLQQAITHACDCGGVLIVYSLSRLARSTRDAIDIAERLAKAGADLVSITEKIDTTTGMGRFFFTPSRHWPNWNGTRSANAPAWHWPTSGPSGSASVGQIPYGNRLAPDGVNMLDEPNEQRAVAIIKTMRAAGSTTRDIEKELQRQGLRPRNGWHWHPKVVLEICRRVETCS